MQRKEKRETHLDSAAAARLAGEHARREAADGAFTGPATERLERKDKKKKKKKDRKTAKQASSPHCHMRTYALLRSGTHHSLHRWMEVGGASVAEPEPVDQLRDVPQRDVIPKGGGFLVIDSGVSMTRSAAGTPRAGGEQRVQPNTKTNYQHFSMRLYQLTGISLISVVVIAALQGNPRECVDEGSP